MNYRLYFLYYCFISVNILADDDLKNKFHKSLSRLSSDFEITDIKNTPIEGIYQVMIGPDVIYMSYDGNYVLKGEILDINNRRNLTEDSLAETRVTLLNTISEDEYIEFSSDSTKKFIYVFTDVDCGYCRKLHQDVPELNSMGIAVRYLAYPRAGANSEIGQEMKDVWCSENRQQALTMAKNREKIESKTCNAPIARQHSLGRELGVTGTPAIFLENGRILPGYIPPNELAQQVNN